MKTFKELHDKSIPNKKRGGWNFKSGVTKENIIKIISFRVIWRKPDITGLAETILWYVEKGGVGLKTRGKRRKLN